MKCLLLIIVFLLDKTITGGDGKLTSGREVPKLLGRVVGYWVWVEVEEKSHQKVLESLSAQLLPLVLPRT